MTNSCAATGDGGWTTGTYAELKRVAAGLLAHERRGHTLAPTELVHEAWLKVRAGAGARSRIGLAASAMRATLVDHARARCATKRGGGARASELPAETAARERDSYVVALDEALQDLARVDGELATLVELRFFGGLEFDELCAALALSPRTVQRRWRLARAWLHRRIDG